MASDRRIDNNGRRYSGNTMIARLLDSLSHRKYGSVSCAQFLNKPIENAELAKEEYRKGRLFLRSLPPPLLFSLTTCCDYRIPCLQCNRRPRPPEADSDTDQAVVDAISPLLRTTLYVKAYVDGEPLFSKCFDSVVKVIEPPTKLQLSTNASLLTKPRAELLLERGAVETLSISLDAATPEIYRIMRPSSNFESVVRNVARYTERARALGRERAAVSLNMTLCRTNLEDVPKLIDLAAELGAEHVEYRHMNDGFDHTANTVDGWDWVYKDQEKFDDPARHDELIFEAYQRAKSRGIRVWSMGVLFKGPFAEQVDPDVLRDLAENITFPQPEEQKWFSPKRRMRGSEKAICHGPWWRMTVQPRGEARLCDYHDITRFKLGNVPESDIMAVWNSKEAITQRRQTLRNGFSEACLYGVPCLARGRL